MQILIAKRYQNDNIKCSLASVALAKSIDFWSNKPESYSKGVSACVCAHADSRFASPIRFALVLVLTGWAKILLDVVNCLSWYIYCEPCVVLEAKWEETVNRYLQQQSQKDEVEGPTLVNQQHHSDSTRRFS